MKKRFSLNISTAIAILITSYVVYYLLLHKNFFHLSIAEIINYSNGLAITKHVLVLGLLPIYIATVIFGAGMLSLYLGSMVQYVVLRTIKNNRP